MMSPEAVARRFHLKTGPFVFEVETACPEVMDEVERLYDPRCLVTDPPFADFQVEIRQPFLRRFFRPQA